jgi:hypothetical protein
MPGGDRFDQSCRQLPAQAEHMVLQRRVGVAGMRRRPEHIDVTRRGSAASDLTAALL